MHPLRTPSLCGLCHSVIMYHNKFLLCIISTATREICYLDAKRCFQALVEITHVAILFLRTVMNTLGWYLDNFCKFLSIQKMCTKTGALKHTVISVDSPSYSRVFTLQSHSPSPPPWLGVFWQPVPSPESFCTSYRSGWTKAGSGNTVDEGHHQDVSACGATACGRQECCLVAILWGYLSHTTSRPTSTPPVSLSSWVTAALFHFLFWIVIPVFFSPLFFFSKYVSDFLSLFLFLLSSLYPPLV